ncbi:MAG: copper resistance protein CopC [Proteobacteria bacterium]|nr:copper resistance protein CopC [Pseudomonadota bacterium]
MVESVKPSHRPSIFLACLLLYCCEPVIAQVSHSAAHQQAAHSTGIAAKTKTSPTDDSVLDRAPKSLELEFPQAVRLVKLTLHDDQRDWVDISFRYNPTVGKNYMWNLPELHSATYYTVDWAVLGGSEQLQRGSFSFSFGAGAEVPSLIREEAAILLDIRTGDGDPTTRSVTPPRTQIIIDRDPPNYDPPFTIDLERIDQAKKPEPLKDSP